MYLGEHSLEGEKELNGNVEEETIEPLGWTFGSRKRCHNQELKVSNFFSPVIKRTDRSNIYSRVYQHASMAYKHAESVQTDLYNLILI